MFFKRQLPVIIMVSIGILTLLAHFIKIESIGTWVEEDSLLWFDIIAAFAIFLGAFIGGVLVKQLGIFKSLLIGGILQMLSNLFYAIQAYLGNDIGFLIVTIGFMNIASGMGTAAFVAYLSSLCNIRYTATQYALLSSLDSLGRTLLSAPSGYIFAAIGWIYFFIFTSIAAIPGIYLLIILKKKNSQF